MLTGLLAITASWPAQSPKIYRSSQDLRALAQNHENVVSDSPDATSLDTSPLASEQYYDKLEKDPLLVLNSTRPGQN